MSLRGHFAQFLLSFTAHGIANEASLGQNPTVNIVSRTLILSTGHRGSENGGVRDSDATDFTTNMEEVNGGPVAFFNTEKRCKLTTLRKTTWIQTTSQ